MEKIPVHIISGFLGAGKTTAILNLLSQKKTDEQWAIVVNEFGKVSIDGQTLKSSNTGEIFEITGGCICCTAKMYLNEHLQNIIKSEKYSRIIIEPTGLGGIEIVTEIVEENPTLFLKPVICLVDILMMKNPIKLSIPIFKRQIEKADAIVFTKNDLVPDENEKVKLIQVFQTNFPDANILTISALDCTILNLDASSFHVKMSSSKFSLYEPGLSLDNYWQKNYTFDYETVFESAKISELFRKYPSILRAKGTIRTNDGWKLLNYTLTNCVLDDCPTADTNEFVIISEKTNSELINNFEKLLESVKYTN